MKNLLTTLGLLLFFSSLSFAQGYIELEENKPAIVENYEITYVSRHHKNKKGKDIYELTFRLKNIGDSYLQLLPEASTSSTIPEARIGIANFPNAESSMIRATAIDFYSPAVYTEFSYSYPNCNYDPNDENSKKTIYKTVNRVIGYGLDAGQVLTGSCKARVREGEKVQVLFALN